MNPHYLLIGLILNSIVSSGQPFRTIFSKDTTLWNVFECEPDAGGTIAYYSFSDTIINSKTYHKIYREFIYNSDQPIGKGDVCGFVNEDTINGKYWFLKFDNYESKECLFMDLGLNEGDTFLLISDFRFMWEKTVIVDSVYMDNDKRVIEFNKFLTNCIEIPKLKFIEGVGAINGFYMGENYEQPYVYSLICKYNNDTLFYSGESNINGNCFIEQYGGISQNELNINILVYPNPSSSLVSVEIDDWQKEVLKYEFYNLLGQKIEAGYIKTFKTDFRFQTNGFYYLVISDEYNIKTIKIIINGN